MSTRSPDETVSMRAINDRTHLDDPYPLYSSLRERSPVLWADDMGEAGAWMVTGHQAATQVLRGGAFSARRPEWEQNTEDSSPAGARRALSRSLFVSDAPRHTRVRHQVAEPFLPRAAAKLRTQVEDRAAQLLDRALERGGPVEVMDAFALALSSSVVAEVVGVPHEDHAHIWQMILHWGVVVDDGPVSGMDPVRDAKIVQEFLGYVRSQVATRRAAGGQAAARRDDLLDALSAAVGGEHGGFADEEEMLSNVVFLLAAGQTTTAHQIGNGILALLDDPAARDRLAADPDLLGSAVPELVRYDSPVQLVKRRALRDTELAGRSVAAGDELFVWLGAANRDPAAFPDPDRLDFARPDAGHVGFGHGPHYCLGSRLGQLMTEAALAQFTARVRNPRIGPGGVSRMGVPTFRGPYQLSLAFD